MIVNVNPYETGYDENTHVMKFSAVAKGVMTVKKDTTHLAVPTFAPAPVAVDETDLGKNARKIESRVVRVSLAEGAEEEEVIYEGSSATSARVLLRGHGTDRSLV